MKNLLFIFIISSLLTNYSATAAELILPNPKIPELTESEKANGGSNIMALRTTAKRLFRTYLQDYNKEFNEKNNIKFVLLSEEAIKSFMDMLDQTSEQDLRKPVEESILLFKRDLDKAALAASQQIKNQSNAEMSMLGVTIGEVAALKQKLVQEEDKNKQLSAQISKLQAEIIGLKKTGSETAKSDNAVPPSAVAPPAVAQPVAVLSATNSQSATSGSNTTKMVVIGLVIAGIISLIFKFKG